MEDLEDVIPIHEDYTDRKRLIATQFTVHSS